MLKFTPGSIHLMSPPNMLPHFECLCTIEFQSHLNLHVGKNLKQAVRHPSLSPSHPLILILKWISPLWAFPHSQGSTKLDISRTVLTRSDLDQPSGWANKTWLRRGQGSEKETVDVDHEIEILAEISQRIKDSVGKLQAYTGRNTEGSVNKTQKCQGELYLRQSFDLHSHFVSDSFQPSTAKYNSGIRISRDSYPWLGQRACPKRAEVTLIPWADSMEALYLCSQTFLHGQTHFSIQQIKVKTRKT